MRKVQTSLCDGRLRIRGHGKEVDELRGCRTPTAATLAHINRERHRSVAEWTTTGLLFKRFLESNCNLNAETFADSLLDELSSWSGHPRGNGQEDDITLLAINFLS